MGPPVGSWRAKIMCFILLEFRTVAWALSFPGDQSLLPKNHHSSHGDHDEHQDQHQVVGQHHQQFLTAIDEAPEAGLNAGRHARA